jgi:hypothetical protein
MQNLIHLFCFQLLWALYAPVCYKRFDIRITGENLPSLSAKSTHENLRYPWKGALVPLVFLVPQFEKRCLDNEHF